MMDPLQQLQAESNGHANPRKKKKKELSSPLLNELDDLEQNLIISAPMTSSKIASVSHSTTGTTMSTSASAPYRKASANDNDNANITDPRPITSSTIASPSSSGSKSTPNITASSSSSLSSASPSKGIGGGSLKKKMKSKMASTPRSNTLFNKPVFSKKNGMSGGSQNGHRQKSDYPFSSEYQWRNGSEEKEEAAAALLGDAAHSWRRTVCHGLFEDEAVSFGALHNESAMLHCSAYYLLSEEQLIEGEVHLTNYLLYFLPKERRSIPGGLQHLIMPIASIARISEQQKNNNCTEIAIVDRWYRPLRLRFVMDKEVQFMLPITKVLQMARALTFPNRMIDLFAFEYFKDHPAHRTLHRAKSAQKERVKKERKERKERKLKAVVNGGGGDSLHGVDGDGAKRENEAEEEEEEEEAQSTDV